jgi:DNA-binding MarR family transcriptional regulator
LMRSRRGPDLSVPQFRVLAFIGRHRGSSLSDVAQHVGTSLSSMSKLVDGLVIRGLVARVAEADDRRRIALSLTQEGTELVALVLDETQAALVNLFAEVAPRERTALVNAMKRLAPLFAAPRPPKEAS